ncbi:LysM peptidoglycan-binding domain-containing protein [Sporosarcina sp. Marseille-Q4063]|uniref:3D domain-containing protein n=1 Tax=Sporosarcina sp. Marseille-Q4063 TaxID=2810514 RepID=UPI001BAED253|nr:3D domain-containing protein [Sporosarcina sp. Marseille-Q4063]QUW22893.1 LysM peptidoglycan-binding domain-containing protein [Sporosarcina sp. Marseille-Q4063]
MKKYIIVFAIISTLAISFVSEQVSALPLPIAEFDSELVFQPEPESSTTVYQVKPGDTLWAIAKKNDVSVEELVSLNELNSNLIVPDQEIKIKTEEVKVKEFKSKEFKAKEDVKKYIVKKGDTLSKIAKDHDISLNDLIVWNQIKSYLIYPNDQLTVSGEKSSITVANIELHPTKIKTPPAPSTANKVAKAPAPAVAKAPSASTGGQEMTMTATAYTAYCEGCSGVTYTGIDLRSNPNQKVIAVDPNIIPLGSRVWVEGYGEAIAGDIGGAIKGNIIDVFIQHKADALNWGRRTVKIKILD